MKSLIHQSMKNRIVKKASFVMASIVVFATTYSLILPALTLDYDTLSDLPGLHLGEKPVVVEVLNSESAGRTDGVFLYSGSLSASTDMIDAVLSGSVENSVDVESITNAVDKTASDTAQSTNNATGTNEAEQTDDKLDTHKELLWVDKDADEVEIEQVVDDAFGDQAVESGQNDQEEQTAKDTEKAEKQSQEIQDNGQVGELIASDVSTDDKAAETSEETNTDTQELTEPVDIVESTEAESSAEEPGVESEAAADNHTGGVLNDSVEKATVDEATPTDETPDGAIIDEQTEQTTEEETAVHEPIDQTFTKPGEYSIHVTAGADAQIPADAVLAVSEIPQNSLQYYTLTSITKDTLSDASAGVVYNRFFDISFVVDGQKIEPKAAVNVEISFDKAQELQEEQKLSVVHFSENQEAISEVLENNPAITEDGLVEGVSFETGSFSVFGVVYTVDFHSEDGYEFSIPGGGYVALSEIVKAVGLTEKYHDNTVDDEAIAEDDEVAAETEEIVDEATPMASSDQESHETVTETQESQGDVKEESSAGDEIVPETAEETTDSHQQESKNIVVFSTDDATNAEDSTETDAAAPVDADDVTVLANTEESALTTTQSATVPLQMNRAWMKLTQAGHVWTNGKNILTNLIPRMFFTPVSALSVEEALDVNSEESGNDISALDDPKIQEFLANVQNVEFSNPDLVWIGKVDEDTTVGELKTSNGLEVQYSEDLTEEQITEMNAQTVEAGDWVLISVQPFTSEESLTITMKNGDVLTVKVTDASNGSTVGGKLIQYQDGFPDGQYIIFTQSGNNYYALTNNGGKVQINYNQSTGQVTYNGNESIIWDSKYVGNSGWKNRYEITAADNGQYYLTPGGGVYNNLLRQYYGRVLMERRSSDNTAAFTVKGDEGGFMYLGWSNSNFAATNSVTNSIYLAKVEDVSTKYTFTVTVDNPTHGTVSGTYDSGTATGEVSSFTVTTAPVDAEGYGYYDASSRPIEAKAKDGYTFSHWEVDNSRFVDDRILNRNIGMASDNVVLKAVFKQNTVVTDEMTEEEIEAQLTAWVSDMISDSLTTNKTAQVKDYNNRIYEVTLSASSGIRRVMPMVDLTFITDVSRSMYFPATLKEVATFTQGTKNETNPGGHNTATGEWVDKDSSLYDWLNKYGDKNTVYYTVADNAAATVMAVYYDSNYNNPADTEHTGVWRYQDSSNVNPPDGQNLKGLVLKSTGKNEPWSNNLTGKLYTQVGTLNRMDYLKMAAEAASDVVFGVDPNARVGLVTFAASANQGQFYGNDSAFTSALEAVDLTGGTNQSDGLDKGRELFWNNHRENPIPKRVAILITDGAPNQSGVTWGTIGQSAIDLKNLYGTDSIELYTLGLSMSMVGENNQNRLKEIATGGLDGGHWAMAEKGSDIVESLKTIIGSVVNEASLKGNFIDEIDEAFYPVSSDTNEPLQAGQMIDLDGNKINTIPEDGKYGVITFDGTNFGVQWSDQVVGYNANGELTWTGKVFIKAKEDFLGGNTINTNKGSGDKFVPTKYIVDGEEYDLRTGDTEKFTRTFTTPYVNVDELSLTQNSTEWTVYLGTSVNPKDQLHALLDKINVREVVSSSTNHMMTDAEAMLGSSSTDASETFPLKEILGQEELSQAEWEQLINKGYLNIPYSPYGHDEVGTLSLSLTKVGDTADYNAHKTTKTGEKVEQYFVTARYVPAARKDVDYRTTPGGAPGALTDSMRSDNAHIINVYEVPLDVYKTDGEDEPLAGATFKLYKIDDTNGFKVDGLNSSHKYVEVASATSGTDGVAQLQASGEPFSLKRGETYYLIESEAPENYIKVNTVWAVQVQTEVGKFTDMNGNPIHSTADSAANGGVTTDMYPFNWDQGVRIVLDGKPVTVIAKGETEDAMMTITDGSYVSHEKAVAFRHTVQNRVGGKIKINVNKRWEGDTDNKPDSVTVKLYRISEKGHKWIEGNVIPCTCTVNGVKEYTCSLCGEKDTHVITAAGHTPGVAHRENEVEATCTTVGSYDMVTRCTVCNAIITIEHVNIDALGHVEGTAVDESLAEYDEHHCYDTVVRCDRCGEELSRTQHDHNWGEWQVTTPAQPGVAGVETRTCDHGHVETRTIAPLPNTTSITYRFYDYWYNDGYTKTVDVTTSADYTIGSSVTISWSDWEDYNATLYQDQVPSEGDWGQTHFYTFNNLNGISVNRTGGGYQQSKYSVTVNVTENMVVDIIMRTTAWNVEGEPFNITITPNRSALHSAQSRNLLSSVQKKTITGSSKALLQKDNQQVNDADNVDSSSLPSFLNGVKTKNQAVCGEKYWEDVSGTYLVKAADDWSLSIPDLPKYNEYGKEYVYYVEEIPVAGYDTTYSGQESGLKDGGEVTITNKKVNAVPLPATGGPGTMLIYGLGAVVAEITGYNILSKRRKKYLNSQRHKIMKKRWS